MKEWPEDNKTVMFDELTEPIIKAIRFAYDVTRKNENKDIPWEGLDIGKSARACCFSPPEALAASNLRYSLDDQGRDALEEIVGLAVQLGIEQGRRVTYDDLSGRMDSFKTMFNVLKESMEQLYKQIKGRK